MFVVQFLGIQHSNLLNDQQTNNMEQLYCVRHNICNAPKVTHLTPNNNLAVRIAPNNSLVLNH